MTSESPVYLHIGVPKSGTTFVQEVLWNNRDRLALLGYTLAADSYVQHARAVRDLTEAGGGERAVGTWDRLAARVRARSSPTVISQEHLSRARSDHVRRVVDTFVPRPVTVVITARDLAGQLASAWQQQVKQRYSGTLAEWVDQVRTRTGEEAARFWWTRDLPALVERWGEHIPLDRVRLVTVPPYGSEPTVLWHRFASACGLDPAGFHLDVRTPNESLGAAQAEVLRRFNAALGPRLVDGYHLTVRRFVTNELLAAQPAYERFGLDEATHAWATEASRAFVTRLADSGVRVEGELDDLLPAPYAELADPALIDERLVSAAAIDLLADLVVHWEEEGRALPRRPTDVPRHGGARRRRTAAEGEPEPH